MYRCCLNLSRTVIRSKKCGDILKHLPCELSTFRTVPAKLLNNKNCNYLPHINFCKQTEEYAGEEGNSSEEEYMSEEDINLISQGDAEIEHKLRVIILEADVMRQDGKCVPSLKYMKHQHWQELLTLKSRSARSKFLTFLFKTEMKLENKSLKKEQRRVIRESQPKEEFPDDGKIRYHLGGNNMFLRIYESTMNIMYNNKLIQAMQFGQKLIVDCGFHHNMNRQENTNCAKQLMLLFAENRFHDDPYDLHFCNLQKDNRLHEVLNKFIPTMYDPDFPLNIHEGSYLDVFPKNKLVYLTPHCREEINEYDHDALYIIGAIVDKANNEPLTLAKAKQEGIRMAKLPLDRHLLWGSGSNKSLTLNQVTSILLDIKHTGDWLHSLRHVPKRKLYHSEYGQSIRPPEQLERLDNDIPVSRQLLQAARQSNRAPNERELDSDSPRRINATSSWKPIKNYEEAPRKERRFNVRSVLESSER